MPPSSRSSSLKTSWTAWPEVWIIIYQPIRHNIPENFILQLNYFFICGTAALYKAVTSSKMVYRLLSRHFAFNPRHQEIVALILYHLLPLCAFSLIPLVPSEVEDGNFLLECILFVLNRLHSTSVFADLIVTCT